MPIHTAFASGVPLKKNASYGPGLQLQFLAAPMDTGPKVVVQSL